MPESNGTAGAPESDGDPVVYTEPELVRWGERIGVWVETPVFFALRGELGAGKSVLARAIARGAGVMSPMPSPTFNLVFRYASGRGATVSHVDLYRLDHPDDVWELGWQDLGLGDEIVLVEWPERAEQLLPANRWEVHLRAPEPGSLLREVRVEPHGMVPSLPIADTA